jgi:spore coat protein U-like protein
MKRGFLLSVFAMLICLSIHAADGTTSLNVNALVSPILSVAMDDPETFNIIGSDRRLIASKIVGNTIVKSSYNSWKITIDSNYNSSSTLGRLKLDGGDTYLPYRFALMDGSTTVVSSFNVPSASQPRTSMDGVSMILYLYFDHSDETVWPRGVYRDTLLLSVTTD